MFNTRIFSYAPFQSCHRHGFVKAACSLATLMLLVSTVTPFQSFASGNVPEVSVSGGAYVIEGDPGGTPVNAVFTFSSNINPVGNSMPVRYTVSDVAGSDFLASGQEGAKNSYLLFSGNRSGQYTATINIPITADNTDESDGYIKVILNPAVNSSNYAVASAVGADTATVAVVDDDVPELTISGGSSVTEGDPGGSAVNATFTVISDIQPRSGMQVRYTVSDAAGSDFLVSSEEGSKNGSLIFSSNGSGQYAATISIPITADNDEEPNGSVKVVLNSPASSASGSYTVASTVGADTATVSVTDDDDGIPELSISGGSSVTEGDPGGSAVNAVFTVTSDILPVSALSVGYTVSEPRGNNFLVRSVEGAKTRSLSFSNNGSGQYTATISIPINPDNIDEANSSVKVVLSAPTGGQVGSYTVASTVGADTATVAVVDDDVPVLSVSGGSSITEGDPGDAAVSAVFTFASDIRSRISIPVRYTVSDAAGSDFLASANEGVKTASLRFTVNGNDQYRSAISIPITADNVDESNGSIKVVLNSPASSNSGSYNISSTVGADTATVSVSDDDNPVISVESQVTSVTEGTNVLFRLHKNTTGDGRVFVDYSVTEEGDFMRNKTYWSFNRGNSIESNQNYSLWISIPTHQDMIDESHGSITLTVLTDQSGNDYARHATKHTATTIVNDDDVPELSVSGGMSVTEGDSGDPAVNTLFTITSNIQPRSAIQVRYTVSDATGSDFLASTDEGAKTHSLSFSSNGNGQYTATISIPITADNVYESNGSVKVVLNAPTGNNSDSYAVDSTMGADTATVSVVDDDVPVLSVSGGSSVTEGDPGDSAVNATFTVTSDIQPRSGMQVSYTVSDATGSDFLASGEEGAITRSLSFSNKGNGQYTATISIPITADNVNESDGSVKVTLTDTSNYNLHRTNYVGTVSVSDDDALLFSVSGNSIFTEGTTETVNGAETLAAAKFTVRSDNDSIIPSNMTIHYRVSELTGDFVDSDDEGLKEITPASNVSSLVISVPINNDNVHEASGYVMVMLVENAEYELKPKYHHYTMLINDDDVPELSISGGGSVTEGDPGGSAVNAVFTFSSDIGSRIRIPVRYTVTDASSDSDFLASGEEGIQTDFFWFSSNGRGQYTSTVSIPITADNIDESNGSVKVVLNPPANSSSYSVDSTVGANTAMISVLDYDKPVISVVSQSESVTEGGDVKFKLVKGTTGDRVSVDYTVSESGDFIRNKNSWTGNKSLTISSNSTDSGWITIQTDQDSRYESSGSITLTVLNDQNGNDYTRHEANHTATTTVSDDENPPVISLECNIVSTIEGGLIHFRFSTPTAGNEVWVDYNVTETGDFLADKSILSGNRREKIASGSTRSGNVYIYTVQDTTDESSGSITLTLLDDQNGNDYNRHATNHTTTITISDDDVPELSISGTGTVMEGSTEMVNDEEVPMAAEFMVTVTNGITIGTVRTIHYDVIELSGDFVASEEEGSKTMSWPAMASSLSLSVPIQDDDLEEVDGRLKVALMNAEDYNVDLDNNEVIEDLVDDDIPVISITSFTADGEDIARDGNNEGSTFEYTLTSTPAPAENIDVKVRVCATNVTIRTVSASNGETVATSSSCNGDPMIVTIPAGSSTSILLVGTEDNATSEFVNNVKWDGRIEDFGDYDGRVRVSLVEDENGAYDISEVPHEKIKFVVVNDNDGNLPIIDIRADALLMMLREDAPELPLTFTIFTADPVTENLKVSYHVYQPSVGDPFLRGDALKMMQDPTATWTNDGIRYDSTVTLPKGSREAQITVEIMNDESIERTTSVDVVLNRPGDWGDRRVVDARTGKNAGYKVRENRNHRAAWNKISDDDNTTGSLPTVSIAGNGPVIEGENAVFTFNAKLNGVAKNMWMSVCVKLTKTEGIEYGPGRTPKEFPWWWKGKYPDSPAEVDCATFENESSTTLTIPIADDGEYEALGGSITAELYAPQEMGYAGDTDNSRATVIILDNEAPEVNISVKSGTPMVGGKHTVIEGTNNAAEFTVTALEPVQRDTIISISVKQQTLDQYFSEGDFLSGTIPTSVMIEENDRSATLSLPIQIDQVDEHHGYIKVTINDGGDEYNVGSNNVARIRFKDDDDNREISIATDPIEISEGETASFTLTASGDLRKPVIVQLTEITGGDYINFGELDRDNRPKNNFFLAGKSNADITVDGTLIGSEVDLDAKSYLVIFNGSSTAEFSLPTSDDDDYEAEGSVKVLVYDRHNVDAGVGVGYSAAASSSQTVTFKNNDYPVMSIESVQQNYDEDDPNGRFTITATLPSSDLSANLTLFSDIEITVLVSEESGGKFLQDPAGDKTVTMSRGTITTTLDVALDDDDLDEPDGRISAALVDGTDYKITDDASMNKAYVTVTDDDDGPVISLAAVQQDDSGISYVTEGNTIRFTVTASKATMSSDIAIKVSVSVDVSEPANVISGDTLVIGGCEPDSKCVKLIKNTTSAEFSITTKNSETEADEYKTITVTLEEGTSYSLGTSESTVKVQDSEWPVVSMAKPMNIIEMEEATKVDEGANILIAFTVTNNDSFFELAYNLTELGVESGEKRHLAEIGKQTFNFQPNNSTPKLIVATQQNQVFEEDGGFTLELIHGKGYVLQGNLKVTIIIRDVDAPHDSISIKALKSNITEGEDAEFLLGMDNTMELNGQVKINVTMPSDPTSMNFFEIVDAYSSKNNPGIQRRDHEMLKYRMKYTIPTIRNDDKIDDDETIELTIVEYRLRNGKIKVPSSFKTARVTVSDANKPTDTDESENECESGQMMCYATLHNGIVSESEFPGYGAEITINAESSAVAEGEDVRFIVTTDGALSEEIVVGIALDQSGDFIDGNLQRTVRLDAGDRSSMLIVNTVDDNLDESDGSVAARITSGYGYFAANYPHNTAMVAVLDDDLSDAQRRQQIAGAIRAVQPAVSANVMEGARSAMGSRIRQTFEGGSGSSISIGGNSNLADVVAFSGESLNSGSVSFGTLIGGSSFHLELFPENGERSPLTIWGVGDYSEITGEGSEEAMFWDGNLLTGHLGFDIQFDRELVFGLTSSFSEADAEYTNSGELYDEGDYHGKMTVLHPFFGWSSLDGLTELQGGIGYGSGEITISQEGYEPEVADTSIASLSMAGARTLYATDGQLWGGEGELKVKGESWVSRQFIHDNRSLIDSMQFDDTHSFLGSEMSYIWKFSSGSTLSPGLLLGIERDSGDEKTEFGSVAEGEISFKNLNGMSVTGSVNTSIANDVQGWGMHGLLKYDMEPYGVGTVMRLASGWGEPNRKTNLLSEDDIIRQSDATQYDPDPKFLVGLEYGLKFLDDGAMLVPYGGIDLSNWEVDELRLGSRMEVGTYIGTEINWTHALQSYETVHQMDLSWKFRW